MSIALLDILPEPAFILDGEGTLLHLNPAATPTLLRLGLELTSSGNFLTHLAERLNLSSALLEVARRVQQGAESDATLQGSEVAATQTHWWELSLSRFPLPEQTGFLVRLRDVTAHKLAEQALHDSEERFRLLAEMTSEGLLLSEDGKGIQANRTFSDMFGYHPAELADLRFEQLVAPQSREIARQKVGFSHEEPYELTCLRKDGSHFYAMIVGRRLPFPGRNVRGTTVRDITAQKQAEEAMRRNIAQEEKIRAQNEMLADLSTPLIPLSEQVMVMPLIGSVDSQRAQQVLESLLDGVSRTGAHTVILDITGVRVVDTQVANALIHAAQAVRLLGAQVLLTGIRAEVAQTLDGLGTDLSGIVTLSTLQRGISYALRPHR